MTVGQLVCRDCGADITGTDDGTGLPFCLNCDEGKDDEHVTADDLYERYPDWGWPEAGARDA